MRGTLLVFCVAVSAVGCAEACRVYEPVGTLDAVNARLAGRDAVVVLTAALGALEVEATDVVVGADTTRWLGPTGPAGRPTADVARVAVFERGGKRTGAAVGAALATAVTLTATLRAPSGTALTTADDAVVGVPLGALLGYAAGSHVARDRRVFVYVGPADRYPPTTP